jgi:hypothetical protein
MRSKFKLVAISAVFFALTVSSFLGTNIPQGLAQGLPVFDTKLNEEALRQGLTIGAQYKEDVEQTTTDKLWAAWDKFWANLQKSLKQAASVAYRQGVRAFLTNLARDTANWISSGGSGQKPLFETEGWGAYLKNAGDQAVGYFLDDLSSSGQTIGTCTCQTLTGPQTIAADTADQCYNSVEAQVGQQCSWETSSGIFAGLNLCQPPTQILLSINTALAPSPSYGHQNVR